jgi:geranylgeranyl reductase family protein
VTAASQHDVIVAGAGPAGALTAWRLAKAGLRVALLDAKEFPRPKACGGGLQPRALEFLPFDVGELVHHDVRSAQFSFQLGSGFSRSNDQPIIHSVSRSEFDHFLVRQAAGAGAELMLGVRLTEVESSTEGCTAITSAGRLRSRYLIGADGANGVSGRRLNDRKSFTWQTAIYAEIPRCDLPGPASGWDHLHIDWGTLPSGYAWVFPKRDSLNIGAGGPHRFAGCLRSYLSAYMRSVCGQTPDAARHCRVTGHQLPTAGEGTRFAGKSVLLVGDAAGLVEPLTGEGLSYAFQSAKIAADCVARSFGEPGLEAEYAKSIAEEIAAELRFAGRLQKYSTCVPGTFYRIFQRSERAWEALCAVLRGHRSLRSLQSEILGRTGLPEAPLDFVLHVIGQARMALTSPESLKTRFDRWGPPLGDSPQL